MRTATFPVVVESPEVRLDGDLVLPDNAGGLVVFAHGSGSSRYSTRNRAVAEVLQDKGFATLLLDLLTEDEEQADRRTMHLRFDIPLLAGRVAMAVEWASGHEPVRGLPLGLFGASTGAAAALVAAAGDKSVQAVVSRGGRPDLAGGALGQVAAPTLLIVGSLDEQVVGLNRQAAELLTGQVRVEIVRGASHLFEEPGALDEVARLAAGWFGEHLTG